MDGQSSNGGVFGAPTDSQPSLEAVGEINVLSNDFSAEYSGVGNIRVTTKRGGAGYHGSVFYNNKNSALAAWTIQDLNGKAGFAPSPEQTLYPTPYFNYNDIGGSFGGPIPHLNKTWFFMAYERNWQITPLELRSSNLPHPTMWTGDFSVVKDSSKPLVPADVLAQMTPEEIANDTVGGRFITMPSRFLNPTVQNLIGTYFPKIGLGADINSTSGRVPAYVTNVSQPSVRDTGSFRLDHDFTDRDHVFAVYNGSAQTFGQNLVQSPYTGLGLKQNYRRNNTVALSYTRAFTNNIVNEARGGFNREHIYRHSNTTLDGFLSGIGFDQSDIDAYGAVVGPEFAGNPGPPGDQLQQSFRNLQ